MGALPENADLLEAAKIDSLTNGIQVTDRAMRALLAEDEVLTIHEYPTTGGLTLQLESEVYVNAPFDDFFAEDSPVVLDVTPDGRLTLLHPLGEVRVERLLPLPGYLEAVDSRGRPVIDVAMSHADRVRLSPLVGCAYDCAFCDLPAYPYALRDEEQLLEALRVAQADERLPVNHVLISGGSPRKAHYDRFERVCRAVVEHAGMPVDLMMSPMVRNLDFLDRLVAAGIHDFSINLEVYADAPALQVLPIKYKVTRRVFEEFIERAVNLLGRDGHVRSLIIPGLESLDETLAGVEWLASLGCTPVLSPFRPGRGTPLASAPPAQAGEMHRLLRDARAVVEAHGLSLGPSCVPCQHNTLTLPWDAL